MSGSLNKATLIGNLGKDPEIRSFQSVAHLSLATSENWKNKDSGTEWHRVSLMSEGLIST